MGITDHLTCLLRNHYVGQETTFRTLYGITDWFKIEKGVWQVCLLLPYLFNLYAEQIMKNARLHESQAGIKTCGISQHRPSLASATSDMQMIPLYWQKGK